MNRRQVLTAVVIVGLLAVVWMQGHRRYELHRPLTVAWVLDDAEADTAHPAAQPQPASYDVDATIGCMGPLDPPDPILDVRSPGMALVGTAPWRSTYLQPNPCIAERSDRRQKLALAAVAIIALGLVGLVAFRSRRESAVSSQDVHLRPASADRPAE